MNISSDYEIGARITLKPSKLKWFAITLIGVLFTAGGGMMIAEGNQVAKGWFVTLFFALVGLVGLLQLTGIGTYLKLGPDGFEAKSLGQGHHVAWVDCSEFSVSSLHRNKMVVFTRRADTGRLASANMAVLGAASALPDTYGLTAERLAELMNAYRRLAITKRSY